MNFTDLYRLNESRAKSLENGNLAPNIRDTEDNKVRTRLINFYKKYSKGKPESEELNWQNSKTLTNDDFDFLDKYMSREPNEEGEYEFFQKNSRTLHSDTFKANKKELERRVSETRAEDLFIDKPEENILFHIYPEISNEDWLFVAPLTYEAAVYINSRECGLGGACWCIGWKGDTSSWVNYTASGDKFLLAFNKKFNTLENMKIDGIPFLEAKDENGNPVTPNTINKWDIRHTFRNGNGIESDSICTYRDLFTKFIFQIKHRDNKWNDDDMDNDIIIVWTQPDKQYLLESVQSTFDINFGVDKEELLNLDFTDFSRLNDIEYKRHLEKLNELREKGYKVNDDITEVAIPNNITKIENSIFDDCDKLKHIDIPKNVTVIESCAFRGCKSLETISIPKSLNKIEPLAFYGCENLTEINIPNGVNKIEGYVFEDCKSLKNISIPDGTSEICEYAFNNCRSLEEINIPDSVGRIGSFAFADCSSLSSVHIPEGVIKIEQDSFAHCSELKNISLPDSVTKIENHAFCDCGSLKNINLSNRLTVIGIGAFSYCPNIENVIIPNSVTKIGIDAFRRCKNLKTISVPANLDISEAGIPETCKIIRRGSSDDDIMTESKINMFNRVYKRFN